MGSKTFDGVQFFAYTDDHSPPHVHCFYGEVEVVLELIFMEKKVRLAQQKVRTRPQNAKTSDVKRIVRVTDLYIDEIVKIWEAAQ